MRTIQKIFNLLTVYIISFTLAYTPFFVFASTSPSKPTIWQIVDATPKKTNILDDVVDATNLNDVVEATGRKLDYDRTPVDNKVYKARVNPRIPETKKAIGSTAMKKLLKVSGWGTAAVEGVKLLLEGIDWVMDVEKQSIWRNKNISEEGCTYCSYDVIVTVNSSPNNPFYSIDSAEKEVERITGRSKTNTVYDWQEVKDSTGKVVRLDLSLLMNGGTLGKYAYAEIIREPEPDIEYLTEDALAEYMLGTHKDFQDQKYKDKLPKPNTWTGVAQVFKPENRFEEENSPTVKIAQEELDKAQPESEEVEIKPTPNPDGGTSGFTLPSFCSWATPVCDFIGWYKKDDLPQKEQLEPDAEEEIALQKVDINWGAQCPEKQTIRFELEGYSIEISIINFEYICPFAPIIKPIVIFGATLESLFILAGIRRNGANENE